MKIYIAGKITGLNDYKEKFNRVEKLLNNKGHKCLNPSVLPKGFEWSEYLKICFAMLEVCDAVYMLDNWRESPGAIKEFKFAKKLNKKIFYQSNQKAKGEENWNGGKD